ncbi:ATP-dependent helicase HrpB [Endothiovibrio diazotrophicus]
MSALPIDDVLPELHRRIAEHSALVLQAPPGAGKTTGVPPALLDAPWLDGRSILILEPRRLAARAAAARMAELLGEPVGERVGYRVRFDHKVSERTRIEVLTEGILTRRLQGDPELEGVGLVIFDEFHERSLHADLALALCIDAQQGLREDLKLLVMSATLDAAPVARLLGDCPVVTSAGRAHPVSLRYAAGDPEGDPARWTVAAIRRALGEEEGDLLAFLPGGGEIRRARRLLEAAGVEALIQPLYGDLPKGEQDRAIRPDPAGRRKVVLATPIAESSLTIDGVRLVVDSGLAREPRFDPRSGLTRLETVRIAADSADQRAGRAGRTAPGVCYRLWGESTQRGLLKRRPPEIAAADLAPLLLELALWGVTDPGQLAWLDPPPAAALARARELLRALEAIDAAGRITAAGRAMAALPLHPRLAHMVREGQALGLGALACDLAALLEERDLLAARRERGAALHERLELLAAYRRHGRGPLRDWGADPAACAAVDRAARQYRRLLRLAEEETDSEESAGLLLALAYPDRVAGRRETGEGYRLSGGGGARLAPHDPLAREPLLAVAALEGRDGTIHLAAPLDAEVLRHHLPGRIATREAVAWDGRQQAVVARREECFGQLPLSSRPLERVDPAVAVAAMVEGVRALGLDALPWDDGLRQWQARLLSLRRWFPEEGWPEMDDEWLAQHLEGWLAPFLSGITRRDHLARVDLAAALGARLDWGLQQRLEEAAPERITVPSGSRIRLEYRPDGSSPVLAVRLQELFGLGETPRVGGGRIAVTLHLLSPARRPIQVTQDLGGFWERTYPEVKKELKGRYPKHVWPDDPWSTPATARAKPRKR